MLKGWRRTAKVVVAGRVWLVAAFLAIIYFVAYIWRLGSLLPGANSDEYSGLAISSSLKNIWRMPINSPYSLLQHFLLKLHMSYIAAGRLTSASFIALFSVCLFYLIQRWFGKPAAIFGVIFFLTNPYCIILGRTAAAQVMLLWLAVIAAALTWTLKTERHIAVAWLALCLSVGLGLFIPGLIWPLAVTFVFLRLEIVKIIRTLPRKSLYIGLSLPVVVLAVVLYALLTGKVLLEDYLWLPTDWPNLLQFAKYVWWSILSLFIMAPKHTNYILGRTPMLGIAEIALLGFGIFALAKRLASSIYLILTIAVPAIILVSINQDTTPLYLVLPITSVLCAIGVRFLYIEWRRVFPLNPLPKTLALVLVASVLAVHIALGLRYTLIAWPHNPETKQAYMLK